MEWICREIIDIIDFLVSEVRVLILWGGYIYSDVVGWIDVFSCWFYKVILVIYGIFLSRCFENVLNVEILLWWNKI